MEDPRELLVRIARILDKLQIKYMVTGGLAVFVWGRPRFTADIDIVIELVHPKVDVFVEELEKVEEAGYIDREAIVSALTEQGEFNFISPSLGLKVDFWILKDSFYDAKRLEHKTAKDILGQKVYFTSPEDLILSKLRWYQQGGGERHLEDAQSVIKKSGKILDYQYLEEQIAKQLLNELWEKICKN